MNSEFLFKLGQSKAEKLQEEFTMIHNESAFEIISKIGPDGFALYFSLSTYAYGKTKVMAYPSNEELSRKLSVSDRTIRRWKAKCELGDALRTVPCYLPNGFQTSSVILFNAAYPEKPEGWNTFAANGFVMINGSPMLREEFENLITTGRTKVSTLKKNPGQNCPPPKIAPDNINRPGWTELSAPVGAEIACTISPESTFFEGEEDQVKENNLKTVVVELVQQFQNLTKETILESKMSTLITRYGVSKVREGLHIILELPEWSTGAEGALCACLRDGWKVPVATRNVNASNRETVPDASNKKQDRYATFYSLFPDNHD